MAPKYKLIYFDARGLAEPIRFLLAYMDEQFEESRIDLKHLLLNTDTWRAMKPNTPFGKLPILEIEGKPFSQSVPLYRYLATKANLVGANDLENLQIDIVADVLVDVRTVVAGAYFETNEELKKAKHNAVINEILPFNLQKLEEIVKQNGYLANGKLSWVDFMFASSVENFNSFLKINDCVSAYPHLKALQNKIFSIPKVKAWIEKRPLTEL